MLFSPAILIAGGATIVLAALDKTFENYGFYWFGTIIKIALPIAAFTAVIYFIETNAILGWLR